MNAEQIRAVEQAAVTPAQHLAIALAAVRAAGPKAIRDLALDDIDLPTGASPSPATGSLSAISPTEHCGRARVMMPQFCVAAAGACLAALV